MRTKLFAVFSVAVLVVGLISPYYAAAASNNDLIDDAIFDNTSTMSAAQIDSFLNTFPNSCISPNSGFAAPDPTGYNPSQAYLYGGPVSAGQAIYDAAQAYEINPQVLIVKLQNEEGLVVGNGAYGCGALAISAAVGYGCPDSGGQYGYSYPGSLPTPLYYRNGSAVTSIGSTCVNSGSKAGFTEQIIHAAWLLKFGRMRSQGNTNWAIVKPNWNNSDDLGMCYGGPMTQGSFKRCASDSAPTYYDGYTTISGQSIHMDSGATASLYWYTPHIQSFSSIFQGWFGSPTSICAAVGNVGGAKNGTNIISYRENSITPTGLGLVLPNNTGSGCVELHKLSGPAGQNWISHNATAMRASNPDNGKLLAFGATQKHTDNLVYVTYGTGNTKTEVHRFSPNLSVFPGFYDTQTNLEGANPSNGTFVSGDFLGRGSDQLAFVLYNGGGGKDEVHLFDPTLQRAVGYYDVSTNLSGANGTNGTFVAGDFLGRGYDQLAFILYSNANGKVEIHLFDKSLEHGVGFYDVPTNLSGINANSGTFVSGDFLGRGYDQLEFILYNGASGKSEVHMFDPSLQKAIGFYDSPTAIAGFDPTQ